MAKGGCSCYLVACNIVMVSRDAGTAILAIQRPSRGLVDEDIDIDGEGVERR
jgi:hypothetical protein